MNAEDRVKELEAEVARLNAESERAWTAANRAEAKVRGWEATVVCTGLPTRQWLVHGWGPGEGGTVEIPALTPEKITSILDRLASLDFYKKRCDLLQACQSHMRDPERALVCDILANGQLIGPLDHPRYTATPAPVAQEPSR